MRAAEHATFAAALCDTAAPLPDGICAPNGTNLAERFAVYRNNVHVSLVNALAENFPIVRAQVGEEFFDAMARLYVTARKPVSTLLTYYGEDFPDHIAAFGPAATLPWLPDLARLERAWMESWAAADAPALPISALGLLQADDLARTRVRVHPAARLVCSEWPVADLWESHQAPSPDLSALEWQSQNVLLTRPLAQVNLRRLDRDASQFAAALLVGKSIEDAAFAAPVIDAGTLLRQLIEDGMIQEICS
jgi:hypothetical protein